MDIPGEQEPDPVDVAEPQEPAEAPEPDPSVKKLVTKFQELVKVPAHLEKWYKRMDADRVYVNEECMLVDDDDCVATNYTLRNQQVHLANIFARDPDISFAPREMVPPQKIIPDPMTGMPMPPPPGMPQDDGLPPQLMDFGKTLEIIVKHFSEEGRFKHVLAGMIPDSMTVGIAWLKLSQQEDISRDAIGAHRQNDQQDNMARCQWLRKRFAAQEFTEDSAEHKELKDCEAVVAEYLKSNMMHDMAHNPPMSVPITDPMTGQPQQDPVTGEAQMQQDPNDPRLAHIQMLDQGQVPDDLVMQPEIPRYLGFNFDPVQPEDIRFDWMITRPEDFYEAQWFAHRVFMDRDQIGSKWQLEPEKLSQVKLFDSAGEAITRRWLVDDPASRSDLESAQVSDRAAVWEFWDKNAGKVFVWVDGCDFFLDEYVPTVVWRGWFPFFPLYFNRVTGRALPLSDTMLTQKLQDEINLLRTNDREARKAALPRFLMRAGIMEPAEKAEFEEGNPFRIHEVQSPEAVAQAFATVAGAPYDPKLYDPTPAIMEMEQLSGVSRQASGIPGGADSATESAIANDQFSMQTDLRKAAVENLIFDVLYAVAEMAIQFLPEENAKAIAGLGAAWPMFDRDTLFHKLKFDVRAGSSGKPDAQKRIQLWTEFANIASALGLPVNGVEVLKEILRAMDVNVDVNKFVAVQPMGMPGMPPMGGPAGAPPGPGGPAPMNAEPAAPGPMGRPKFAHGPSPSQIPNHPGQ